MRNRYLQMEKQIIFVLGMHRSGTSALTRVLSLCGGSLPPRLLTVHESNTKGHWEPIEAIAINDDFLLRHGSSWADPTFRTHEELFLSDEEKAKFVSAIRDLIRQWSYEKFLVIKEPQITTLIEFWAEAAQAEGFAIKSVIAVRHPSEVAASLAKRDQITANLANSLWSKYNLLGERYSRRFPRVFVEYSALINDWRPQISRISQALGLDLSETDDAEINDFLVSDLYHHRRADEPNKSSDILPTQKIYRLMLAAAQDMPLNTQALDDIFYDYRDYERTIRTGYDEFQSRFARMSPQAKVRQLEEGIQNLRTENDAQIAEKDTQLFEKDAQIAQRDAQIDEYLYHLERINASPWWRLGMWFSRLVQTLSRLVAGGRPAHVATAPGAPAQNVFFSANSEPAAADYVPLFRGSQAKKKQAKLICFYLPQFHAIPENNFWWGEGFTEWTNVRTAQPKFEGHHQPHVPGELGYYNLLDPEVQRRQIELAKLYGVEGFCFYFYWFGGRRLLERPIENYLNDRTLDLPFCLCWANENWTRRWDGRDREILMAQHHSPQDDIAFIRQVARYMLDPRYISIDGKPLLIIYRPMLLPSPKETMQRWRSWCRDNGIGEIYLAYTQSFEKVDPAEYDFDAAIEFPPNAFAVPNIGEKFLAPSKRNTAVHDWREFVDRSENYQKPKYKLFRGVCPGWDNTPRRKNGGSIFINSAPALYQRWLNNAIRDTRMRNADPDERLVFINAWNEWGEGAHLEPDARYGYAYLQATRDAVCNPEDQDGKSILLVTHDCHQNGAQFQTLQTAKQLKFDGFKVAIIALDGGKLQDDFARVGRMINAEEVGAEGVANFLASLRAEGMRDAITSTVVCGSIMPQLKSFGFRVLSLIHELPGIIRDMRQEANAEAIAELADKVVFPAEFVHQRFSEIASVDADKVVIRHQGLLRKNPYKNRNAEAYRAICEKHHLPAGAQIVLSVAYADARKAPDLLVESAAHVLRERPNTIFIWIGDFHSKMEHEVGLRIEQLGLQERVLFIGFDREPMAYYAAASVYALPSREDPFPNVVIKSADVGVPVVAFEGASGAGEFILEHGGRLAGYLDTGRLRPPNM